MTDLSEISTSIARVEEGVAHLNEKMGLINDNVIQRLEEHQERFNNHAGRVKSLETTRARQKGAGAALGAVTAVVGSLLAFFKNW